MPILKHALKKLRVDKRREKVNKRIKTKTKRAIKTFKEKPSEKSLGGVFSALDRAAKKKLIHKRKADRLKSRLSALLRSSRK